MADIGNHCNENETTCGILRNAARILDTSVNVLDATREYQNQTDDNGDRRITGIIASLLSCEMRIRELAERLNREQSR